MTAPIRIRTKDGISVNLALVREEMICAQGAPDTYCVDPDHMEAVLDALEAALRVPPLSSAIVGQSDEMSFGNGWDAHERIVRQAAGMIEENKHVTIAGNIVQNNHDDKIEEGGA